MEYLRDPSCVTPTTLCPPSLFKETIMPINTSSLKFFHPDTDPKIDWSKVDQNAIEMLDVAREHAAIPFRITSHYRTPEHSLTVGGSNTDAHTEDPCSAFDIAFTNTLELHSIISGLMVAGFERIGINIFNHHVHADNSEKLPTPRIWVETPEKGVVGFLREKGYVVEKAQRPPRNIPQT